MKDRWIYQCAECGAKGWHAWWEALRLPKAEEPCPACGKWARFDLVSKPVKRKAA